MNLISASDKVSLRGQMLWIDGFSGWRGTEELGMVKRWNRRCELVGSYGCKIDWAGRRLADAE